MLRTLATAMLWWLVALLTLVAAQPDGLSDKEKLDTTGTLCNGHALLCDKPFNLITLPATHVSHAVRKDEYSIGTQDKDIQTQLKDGIRGFTLDIHPALSSSSTPQLCFLSCDINDGGSLADTLAIFHDFLTDNVNDIIVIVVSNPGGVSTANIAKAFTGAGLDKFAYTDGPELGDWPTASDIINTGKRLVAFGDKSVGTLPSWMLNKETITQYTKRIVPSTDPWPMDRENWRDGKIPFFITYHVRWVNATVDGKIMAVPYGGVAAHTNDWDLVSHTVKVRNNNFQWPSLIIADFYDQGQLIDTALRFNSLPIPGDQLDYYYPDNMSTKSLMSSSAGS
ncbi:hypothetical protein H4R35_007120, partial [Dimargaris xerosporica]